MGLAGKRPPPESEYKYIAIYLAAALEERAKLGDEDAARRLQNFPSIPKQVPSSLPRYSRPGGPEGAKKSFPANELARHSELTERFGLPLSKDDLRPLEEHLQSLVELLRGKNLTKSELLWTAFRSNQKELYAELLADFTGMESKFGRYFLSENEWMAIHVVLGIVTEVRDGLEGPIKRSGKKKAIVSEEEEVEVEVEGGEVNANGNEEENVDRMRLQEAIKLVRDKQESINRRPISSSASSSSPSTVASWEAYHRELCECLIPDEAIKDGVVEAEGIVGNRLALGIELRDESSGSDGARQMLESPQSHDEQKDGLADPHGLEENLGAFENDPFDESIMFEPTPNQLEPQGSHDEQEDVTTDSQRLEKIVAALEDGDFDRKMELVELRKKRRYYRRGRGPLPDWRLLAEKAKNDRIESAALHSVELRAALEELEYSVDEWEARTDAKGTDREKEDNESRKITRPLSVIHDEIEALEERIRTESLETDDERDLIEIGFDIEGEGAEAIRALAWQDSETRLVSDWGIAPRTRRMFELWDLHAEYFDREEWENGVDEVEMHQREPYGDYMCSRVRMMMLADAAASEERKLRSGGVLQSRVRMPRDPNRDWRYSAGAARYLLSLEGGEKGADGGQGAVRMEGGRRSDFENDDDFVCVLDARERIVVALAEKRQRVSVREGGVVEWFGEWGIFNDERTLRELEETVGGGKNG